MGIPLQTGSAKTDDIRLLPVVSVTLCVDSAQPWRETHDGVSYTSKSERVAHTMLSMRRYFSANHLEISINHTITQSRLQVLLQPLRLQCIGLINTASKPQNKYSFGTEVPP